MSSFDAIGNRPAPPPPPAGPSAQPGARRSRPWPPRPAPSSLRDAFGRLSAVLTEVAVTADASAKRRCPHRGVRSRCRHRAPCRNQVAVGEARMCGGDAHVRFEPAAEPVPPSPGAEVG
jgi:hypothetical protein